MWRGLDIEYMCSLVPRLPSCTDDVYFVSAQGDGGGVRLGCMSELNEINCCRVQN